MRTRPAGRKGDFGNFLIVFTITTIILPYLSHRSRFFRLNSQGIMENSLHENLYNVVNSIIFCSKEASASVVLDIVFSLTWPASMQIYWNKIKRLHKKRV